MKITLNTAEKRALLEAVGTGELDLTKIPRLTELIADGKNTFMELMKQLNDEEIKVIYPKEFIREDFLERLLLEIGVFVITAQLGAYFIGIFFIIYVILSRVYRSRIKDYSILRTLGVTKKDMSKIVNVEMRIIGYSTTIFTYLVLFHL